MLICYSFPTVHKNISESCFQKIIIYFLLNISMIGHDKIFRKKSIYATERNIRSTCSSVEMLKKYRVRDSL